MALFSTGQILTAAQMNSLDTRISAWEQFAQYHSDLPAVSNVASGWTVNMVTCYRQYGLCTFAATLTPSAAIAAGNISNINIFTIPTSYAPHFTTYAFNSDVVGQFTITGGGQVSLAGLAIAWPAGLAATLRTTYATQ